MWTILCLTIKVSIKNSCRVVCSKNVIYCVFDVKKYYYKYVLDTNNF